MRPRPYRGIGAWIASPHRHRILGTQRPILGRSAQWLHGADLASQRSRAWGLSGAGLDVPLRTLSRLTVGNRLRLGGGVFAHKWKVNRDVLPPAELRMVGEDELV